MIIGKLIVHRGAKVPSPIAPSLENNWRLFPIKSRSFLNTWHFLIKIQKYLAVSGLLSIFEANRENARKMKELGISVEIISQVTGLTINEVDIL